MVFCIPILLRPRTSRVCQELRHFCRVLTSFVPPVHNQGVCLAPLQGHALRKIFLPTTGSFFVLSLTDLFLHKSLAAPCGGRFPNSFFMPFSLSVTAEFSSHRIMVKTQFNRNRVFPVFLVMLLAIEVS